MSVRQIGPIELRDMKLLEQGQIIRGHLHKFDHASLLYRGGARITPCEDTGERDDYNNIVYRPIESQGVDYFAHDADLMKEVAKLVSTKSIEGLLKIQAAIIKEWEVFNSVMSAKQIPAVNIPAGLVHQIVALRPKTLFLCIHPTSIVNR